ncbi:interleukin-21 receptor-like isoform X2 [Anguilla anguilla]|uniref:interleukin-21 receptor-like isoform X2 n=1 Tax=Anguilla anguilla TaxID=7936 RepID=UPI0015AA04BE|nr:interleukin-21 receptor-like isoform X2 [Anguilla anguilla]
MRVPAAITLLVFSSLIQCTTCTCNITCTTDYISSLNCSCPGPTLASDYHLEAECRDEDENISVSCEIKAPERWCILELDPDEFPIGAFGECTVQAKNSNGERGVEQKDSTTLKLYENIKLRPPFNISLTVCKDSYNVSWKMDSDDYIYFNGYMVYRVRTRIKGEAKPSYHYVYEDRQYLEIPSSVLQSEKDYEVDVQARVNPHRIENGFWSEWSSSAKWRTKRSPTENKNIFYKTEPGEEGNGKDYWQYCFLLLIVAPCLLCFFGTRLWLRKVHVYIPSPEIFFRPLYHAYEGDFKKWVGPTFTLSETDCLEGSTAVSVVKEKQAKSLERLCDIEGEDGASTSSSPFLGMASLSSSKQSSEDCGHSPGLDGSAGHVSIDTVTVLEEESQGSGSSRDPGEGRFEYPPFGPEGNLGNVALGLLAARCRWDAVLSGGRVSGGAGSSEGPSSRLALDCLEPRPRHDGSEPDQSSLESFSFTEHSEDGYPAVTLDMDTIDSGFLESDCSSPVHSDPDVREKMDAPVLVGSFHTNYVKQWVANTDPSAPQEDSES